MSLDHINAFTPPVVVLDRLAEIVAIIEVQIAEGYGTVGRLAELSQDSGVQAWMARMREMERIPPAPKPLSFTNGIRQMLNTPGPTQTMIDDAGTLGDYIDTRLKNSIYIPEAPEEDARKINEYAEWLAGQDPVGWAAAGDILDKAQEQGLLKGTPLDLDDEVVDTPRSGLPLGLEDEE